MPTANGLQWVDLDPSWKLKDIQPGMFLDFSGSQSTYPGMVQNNITIPALPVEQTYDFDLSRFISVFGPNSFNLDPSFPNGASILDNGLTFSLQNVNARRAYPLDFVITNDTILDFDFKTGVDRGQILGIGLAGPASGSDGAVHSAPIRAFKLAGGQNIVGAPGWSDADLYTASDQWQHYSINIGQDLSAAQLAQCQYLFFANSDTAVRADSYFSNVRLHRNGSNATALLQSAPTYFHTVKTVYDAFGRPVQMTNADGTSTSTIYDAAGRVRYTIDELGHKAENIYDKYGRLERTVAPDPDGPYRPADSPYTRYEYDAAGNVVKEWDFFGKVGTSAGEHTDEFLYDARNRLVTTIRKDGSRVDSVLNPVGQMVASVDALANSTYSVYDDRGRVIEQRQADPDGSGSKVAPVTTHKYDAAGNVTETTDPLQNTTKYKYDSLNRLREESHAETIIVDDSNVTDDVGFSVDLGLRVVDADANAYDGSRLSVVGLSAAGASIPAQATWKFNNLAAGMYCVAISTVSIYSQDGAFVEIPGKGASTPVGGLWQYKPSPNFTTVHGDREIGWNWVADVTVADGENHLEVLLNRAGGVILADAVRLDRIVSTSHEYDKNGNLIKETDTRGNDTKYFYDELNRLQQTQTPDPDGAGSLTRLVTDRIYDGYGNLVTERHGYLNAPPAQTHTSFRTDSYEYDQRNRLTQQIVDYGTTGQKNITTKYEYDDAGNQTLVIDPPNAAGHQSQTHFRYDALNRVVDEYQDFGDGIGSAPLVTLGAPVAQGNHTGPATLTHSNTGISLSGDAWVWTPIAATYHATHRTVLEFDLSTTHVAQFHQIGFDTDTT